MAKNVFVLGLTDFQRHEVETIRNADRYAFHDLIGYERLIDPTSSFGELLDRGRRELEAFDGTIDAIIAHWDFPTSVLVPILAREHGIPAPSLESVLTCEHKYWSRLEQRASVPDHVPGFSAFDPFADDPRAQIDLDFPFWVKPVKAHSSHLGFKIDDRQQFDDAVAQIREEIGDVADAFDEALAMADLPPEIRDAPGSTCLAEEIMTGLQVAPEGSLFNGRFDVHGVFDMHKDEAGESIERMDYPASLVPIEVQDRMADIAERYLRHVGFDNSCFNVEYLWDRESDRLCIIEVNTRMSQSHSDLFAKVDGMSNHEVAVDIALGQEPDLPKGRGDHAVASKIFILHGEDGIVRRVPSDEDIAALAEVFPGTEVIITVSPGDRLADLALQDSYNYKLGSLFLGAEDHEDLDVRRRRCLELLHSHFEFDPPGGAASDGEAQRSV